MPPTSAPSCGRPRGRSSSATPSRSTRCATRPPPGRTGLLPLLRPIDTGLEAFPEVALTAEETLAVARGQFVSPAAGLPGPSDHYRLRGPDGALVAIATSSGGRLAPDKVFVSPAPVAAARS